MITIKTYNEHLLALACLEKEYAHAMSLLQNNQLTAAIQGLETILKDAEKQLLKYPPPYAGKDQRATDSLYYRCYLALLDIYTTENNRAKIEHYLSFIHFYTIDEEEREEIKVKQALFYLENPDEQSLLLAHDILKELEQTTTDALFKEEIQFLLAQLYAHRMDLVDLAQDILQNLAQHALDSEIAQEAKQALGNLPKQSTTE